MSPCSHGAQDGHGARVAWPTFNGDAALLLLCTAQVCRGHRKLVLLFTWGCDAPVVAHRACQRVVSQKTGVGVTWDTTSPQH